MAKTLSVLLLALSLTACGNKDKGKDKAGSDGSAASAASGDVKYADVDCAKMIDHVTPIMVAEQAKGMSDADAAAMKKRVADGRDTAVAACEKEKNTTKKLTVEQYDCLMKATDLAGMQACAPAQ
jgi:hypothetical protein